MKKRILSIILIILCLFSYGCTDTPKESYVEYISSVHTYTPFFGFYPTGGYQVTYDYYYWGNEIADNAPDIDTNLLFNAFNYSIEILEFGTGKTCATIDGAGRNGRTDFSKKNGFLLGFSVFFSNADTKVRISIKFQEIEIYNGIVYKNKTEHNNAHQLEKDG
jgi:hypothetical protein